MSRSKYLSRLWFAALLFSSFSHAHDDVTLDSLKAPHGGQLRMAGPYHLELVVAATNLEVQEGPITVYLTDHAGQAVSSQLARSTATLLTKQGKITVPLNPAGANKLEGRGKYLSDPQMKAVISLTFPNQATEQARFTPLRPASTLSHTH